MSDQQKDRVPSSKLKRPHQNINGTRSSLLTNQVLISSGISTLDTALGGGIAVGSVLLIEEDTFGTYSEAVLKCYLAEGVATRHSLFIASVVPSPGQLKNELPAVVEDKFVTTGRQLSAQHSLHPLDSKQLSTNDLKIAWRYQNLATEDRPSNRFGHCHDLSKFLTEDDLTKTSITLFQPDHCGLTTDEILLPSHKQLLLAIQNLISSASFSADPQVSAKRNILRIGIHSLDSMMWNSCKHSYDMDCVTVSLCRFFYALRMIMRSSLATCVVTVPSCLFDHAPTFTRLRHLSDTVIKVESFATTPNEHNPVYKDYHGMMHIVKLPRLSSLVASSIPVPEFIFRVKNGKFMMEKPHLPPDLSELDNKTFTAAGAKDSKFPNF